MKIQPHKSAGSDDMHSTQKEFITIAQAFHILLKQSFTAGEIASDWHRTNTCALFKKGKRIDLRNYRPAPLTSQVSKLLEPLMQYSGDWTNSFDHIGTSTDIIYTDSRKAFDSDPHQRLANKITQYRITGNLHPAGLTPFLTNRMQRAVCGGK